MEDMEQKMIQDKLKFIFFMIVTVILSAMITITIYFLIALAGMKDINLLSVRTIAGGLTKQKDGYTLSNDCQLTLQKNHCFAFLIDGNGKVIWKYDKPREIPDEFSLQEVASFSRWYLQDYPVQNWQFETGIIVMGYPKNTLWKYVVEMPNTQAVLLFKWMIPLMMLIMAFIFIVVSRWNKGQLRRQDKARTEWIAGVSHDIRTPLTMILGYAGELNESMIISGEQKEQTQIILAQSQRIKILVEDFNMANKLTYGMVSLDKNNVKISSIIRQVVADIINSNLEERFQIVFEASADYVVKADEKLIYRAIANLIQNSICHNPSGCNILVSLNKQRRNVVVSVEDNGVGFGKEILSRRFDSYQKLTSHGLGLVIVNRIIRAHHGTLKLYNKNGAVAELRFH